MQNKKPPSGKCPEPTPSPSIKKEKSKDELECDEKLLKILDRLYEKLSHLQKMELILLQLKQTLNPVLPEDKNKSKKGE